MSNKKSYLLNLFKNHIYFFGFFIFIILYNLIFAGITPFKTTSASYSFHLVDFSVGFCSKILPGAIYSFFFDNTSTQSIYLYCMVLLIIFFVLVSFSLERLVKSVDSNNQKILLFILLFFTSGTLTFSLLSQAPGSHDFYWAVFFLLSLICISSPYLYIFIIPLSLAAVLVNYGYLVSHFPFIILLMIYKLSALSKKNIQIYLGTITFLTVITSFLLGIYFLMFEIENLNYSADEFNKMLNSKGFSGTSAYYLATLYNQDTYHIFNNEFNTALISNAENPLQHAFISVYHRFLIAFSGINWSAGAIAFLLSVPIFILISLYLHKVIKAENNKLKRFSLSMIVPMSFFTILASIFLSQDIVRFIGTAFACMFTSFLYIVYIRKGEDLDYIKSLINKVPVFYRVIYAFLYFTTNMSPVE